MQFAKLSEEVLPRLHRRIHGRKLVSSAWVLGTESTGARHFRISSYSNFFALSVGWRLFPSSLMTVCNSGAYELVSGSLKEGLDRVSFRTCFML